MNDPDTPAYDESTTDLGEQVMPLDMGRALPPGQPERLPLLDPGRQGVDGTVQTPAGCAIAQGMHFSGIAQLVGPCSIGGEFEGYLVQVPGTEVSVVVTQTGRVKGDITAQRISVQGQVDGLLDAGTGEVLLHDGSQVQGRVRYGRIQVNGADLNATLERVMPAKA